MPNINKSAEDFLNRYSGGKLQIHISDRGMYKKETGYNSLPIP